MADTAQTLQQKLEIESWKACARYLKGRSATDSEATLERIEGLFVSSNRSFLCSFHRFSDADQVMANAIIEKKDLKEKISQSPEISRWLSCALNM